MHKAVSYFNCNHWRHISIDVPLHEEASESSSTVITNATLLASKLPSEAEAIDVGTFKVYRAVQIRQH